MKPYKWINVFSMERLPKSADQWWAEWRLVWDEIGVAFANHDSYRQWVVRWARERANACSSEEAS